MSRIVDGISYILLGAMALRISGMAQPGFEGVPVAAHHPGRLGPVLRLGLAKIDTGKFEATARLRAEGNEKACAGANGIWKATLDGVATRLRILPVGGEFLKIVLRTAPQDLYQMYFVETTTGGHFMNSRVSAVLVDRGESWQFISLPKPIRLQHGLAYPNEIDDPLLIPLSLILGKVAERISQESPQLRFDSSMTHGEGPGIVLDRLDYESLVDIIDLANGNVESLTAPNVARVPFELYDLKSEPEYVTAASNRHYSRMLDLIWQRSLKFAKGDQFLAALVGLTLTDLRHRGICGAIRGLRGRTIVPMSIFDGEEFHVLRKNRLDGPQHFFGYTLIGLTPGGHWLGSLSTWQYSFRKYYLPSTANLFRDRHEIGGNPGDRSIGSVDDVPGLAVVIRGSEYETERPYVDVVQDSFINHLGLEFAATLRANSSVLPSQIINSPTNEEKKAPLGLGVSTETRWLSYDPNEEVPRASARLQEHWRVFPESFLRALENSETSDEKIGLAQTYCRYSSQKLDRRLACTYHDGQYRQILSELKKVRLQ